MMATHAKLEAIAAELRVSERVFCSASPSGTEWERAGVTRSRPGMRGDTMARSRASG